MKVFKYVLAFSIFLGLSIPGFCQSNVGSIVGTVKDQSGAVIVGVSVKAVNVDTSLSRTVTSDDKGGFVITNLPVGAYKIEARQAGFEQLVKGPIQLLVNQVARVDLSLRPGAVTETVNVTSSGPVVNSENGSVGDVITHTSIAAMPLNGRNFIQLGQLVAGTTQGAPGDTTVRSREGGVALTANGQRADQNNWMLDGADNNAQMFGMVVIVPALDSVREFRVQTGNYSAQLGESAGAVVSVETKSGTNKFSWDLYEYLRNDALDSPEYFATTNPSTGQKIKAPLRYNQFGGSIGGPIVHNKTFFFFNYEAQRINQSATLGSVVPTAAERAGDFTGDPTIYDPLTYDASTGQRQPFPNNQIPSNRIFPAAQKMLAYIPLPNNPDPTRNYVRVAPSTNNYDQWHLRVDHTFSAKHWIMGSIFHYNTSNDTANAFPLDDDILQNFHRSGIVRDTYMFSPSLVNELSLTGTRYHFLYTFATAGQPITAELGLPTADAGGPTDGLPDTRISGMARLGGNAAVPLDRIENTIALRDSLSWVHKAHSINFGGSIRAYRSKNYQPEWARGRYTFTGVFTGQAGSAYKTGFADFLLGLPARQNLLNDTGLDAQRPQNWHQAFYVQDDWRALPNLTLNLGFRYERDGAWTDAHNHTAVFDPTTGEVVYAKDWSIPFPIPFPHRFGNSNVIANASNGWSPRFGFAWSPLKSRGLVVRGGYGIFWALSTSQDMVNTGFIPPGLIQDVETSSSIIPSITMGVSSLGSDPADLLPKIPSFITIPLGSRKNPYTQQYSLTLEQPLGQSTKVSVAYVGNRTIHLAGSYEGNPALPPAPGALQPRRRWPAFGSMTFQDSYAQSNYNSLQVTAERRFSAGVSFLGSYTWSKSLDNMGGEAESSGGGVQNPADLNASKGLSGFDLRHRFTFAPVYDLPIGRGRRFLSNSNGFLNGVVGGWQLSGIITLQTGFPFSAVMSGDTANAGTGRVFPNLVGPNNGNLTSGRTIDHWFNTAAFVAPAPYTFGNAGRNILIGPSFKKVDLSLMKNFKLHESHALQFRADCFNVFNHPNFQFPGATVGTPNFGVIRSAYPQREIQLALKYSY